jgi:hypothetical protein
MRVLVVTSCTGEKVVTHDDALTLADFEKGAKHVAHRERELATLLTSAEDLYSGLQHVRLMRGVRAFREGNHSSPSRSSIDLWIVSAGYGVIPANRKIAPYECTFQNMKKATLRRWAATLHLPEEIRRLLADHYDLALVLLGDSYLEACAFDAEMHLGGPTILFCGSRTAAHLPQLPQLRSVVLTNAEAKRFSCGLVGLKGELAARVLERLAQEPNVLDQLQNPATDVLALLERKRGQVPISGKVARLNPKVDQVIRIPEPWWQKPHREKLRYFIPEWDDLVDPDYDFATDTHSGGSGN